MSVELGPPLAVASPTSPTTTSTHTPSTTSDSSPERALPISPIDRSLPPTPAHDIPPPTYSSPANHSPAEPTSLDDKPIVPASHPAADHPATEVLPVAPNVHPDAQADAISREKPEVVAGEVEKMKADRREIEGKPAGGTVVHGLEDDKLWALLRRFDQQVTHTLTLTSHTIPPGEPDLRRTKLPSVPFNSDVLKSNLERCYATAGVVFIRFYREIARLRSWAPEEQTRTIWFLSVYAAAWVVGYAIPVVLGFCMVLIMVPASRYWAFPPELPPMGTPPSATDPRNEKGDESMLGEVDGEVRHRSKAEQVEEQAWEFTQLAQGFLVKVAMGGRTKGSQGNAALGEKTIPDSSDDDSDDDTPQGLTGQTEIHESTTSDGSVVQIEKPMSDKRRKKKEAKEAKVKRDQIVAGYTKAGQDALGDIADLFECLANALSPPPPYPPNYARYKLALAIFLPLIIVIAITPPWVIARLGSFALGFALFGQPVIEKGVKLFLEWVPNWAELLDLRNSLLSGVPTNDQLVLHLLRVGERVGHPLPRAPPPPLAGTPKEKMADTAPDPDAELVDSDGEPMDVEDLSGKDKVVHKTKSKVTAGLKMVSKKMAGFRGDVTVDGVKKKLGTKVDRVIWRSNLKDDGSREEYPAKLDGTSGKIIIEPINAHNGLARVSFVDQYGKSHFTRQVNDIVEIKRSSVSIPRAILGWASGADIESQTLLIRMKSELERARSEHVKDIAGMKPEEGDHYEFKTVYRREELFVRLISLGNQRWESL